MGREDMRPVELAEESSHGIESAPSGSRASADPADARRRVRRRRWALAAAATLVAGLVSTQAVLDARERTHLARLATVPGVLAPVDSSLRPLWSTSDWSMVSPLAGGAVGDLSIGAYIDTAGERTARAVRTRTGEVVWSTILSAAEPTVPSTVMRREPFCSVDERATTPRAVCLVSDATLLSNADGPPTPAPATFARLVVLDPTTGQLLAHHDEPLSSAFGVGLLDGFAVVASRSDQDHLVVVSEDPLTGVVRWRFESSAPLAPALPDTGSAEPSGLNLIVVAGHIAVSASGGEMWVLSSDGALVDSTPPGNRTGVRALRSDVVAVVDLGDPGSTLRSTSTGRSMRLVDHAGSLGAASDKAPVTLQVDDGSVPNLLFTMSDRLVAWDLRTGTVAWTNSVSVNASALLVDGRLYARTSSDLLYAIDAASGTTLWAVPLTSSPDGAVSTDGRSILASEPSTSGPPTLVAFATDDGRRLWKVRLPDSVAYVWTLGRRLVGVSEDGSSTVVLG